MWDWYEIGFSLGRMVVIFILSLFLFLKGYDVGAGSLLEEMNKYGNVRIDGKVYVIEEVINNVGGMDGEF